MRRLVLIILVFVATRALAGYVADHPDVYPDGSADASFEVANYAAWSNQMQDLDHRAYRDFHVGYPPAALLLANVPYAVDRTDFRRSFIAQSVLLDAFGLWAVYRLARRRDAWWGVVAWLGMIPLLGPVAYTRLDLAVAACLAWALERVEAGRWTVGGFWLGVGAAIKVTPGLLLPAVVLAAPKRWRPVAAATSVGLLFLLPFTTVLSELFDEVLGGNVDRGVHAESLWGSLALLVRVVTGASVVLVGEFGATDIHTSFDTSLRVLSNVLAVGVLADSAIAAVRRVRRGDGAHTVLVAGAALVLLTAVGRVFSPQYLLWSVASMSVGLAVAPRALRWSACSLAGSIALAHLVYPVLFYDYLAVRPAAVVAGVARNVLLLAAGLLAVRAASRYRCASGLPTIEEQEVVEPIEADVLVRPDG